MRGTCKGPKRYRLVIGIEQAIELSTACLHPLRQFRPGEALICHELVELKGDHTLDSARRDFFVNAFLLEEVLERRTDPSFA